MNWILTQHQYNWANESQFLNYLRNKLPVYTTGSGPVTGATNGLSLVGPNIGLGGVTNANTIIDQSVNGNDTWFKSVVGANGTRNVTIGSVYSTPWGGGSGLVISKSINDDAGRCNLLTLTSGDTTLNGFLFLNYQDVPGEILPNLRVASNAPNGQSAAWNLDLAGRDSTSEFSHFSVFFYDYDQYVLHGNQAPAMANSNLVNFTNGTGGALVAQTRHFLWVDKNYNFMIGNNSWTDRPLGALHIGDNSATYAIYQIGAGSVNWFAGPARIGGAVASTANGWLTLAASTTTRASLQLTVGVAPTSPVDNQIWLESNTNTGLKIRINGVTKTFTLS